MSLSRYAHAAGPDSPQLDVPPATLAAFEARACAALAAYMDTAHALCAFVVRFFATFDSVDGLAELMHVCLPECLAALRDPSAEPARLVLDRRSYLGLFVRRARLTYELLLDHERLELAALCCAWRDGAKDALVDEWRASAQAHAYAQWRRAAARGDASATKRALHAFFDYTLPGCDQEQHQHALLNLAHFHVDTHGFRAARTVLDEAILLARTVGDTECMRACDHLLERLAYVDPQPLSDTLLTALDADDTLACAAYAPRALWRVRQDRARGAPLLGLVQRVADTTWASRGGAPDAAARPGADWEPRPSVERSAARPSAVLARLWHELGVPALADTYAVHVARQQRTAPSPEAADDALDAVATAAYAAAERGAYADAVAQLTAPALLARITTHALYMQWHPALWRVLWLRARRRGDATARRRIAQAYPCLDEADVLDEARALVAARQGVRALEPLTQAIAACEAQQAFPGQRAGLALLADTMSVSLRMPEAALALVEEILPQALADANVERRGLVHATHAKCLVTCGDERAARAALACALDGVWKQWRLAYTDLDAAECYAELAPCAYLAARLAERAGDVGARDAAVAVYRCASAAHATDAAVPRAASLVSRMGQRVTQTEPDVA